jgi:hypothetical protein
MTDERLIKKSISMPLDNEHIISAMMRRLGFEEMQRVVTGGVQSAERLVITYQGRRDRWDDCSLYVEIQQRNARSTFISIRFPDGIPASSVDAFKELHKKPTFEIKTFE